MPAEVEHTLEDTSLSFMTIFDTLALIDRAVQGWRGFVGQRGSEHRDGSHIENICEVLQWIFGNGGDKVYGEKIKSPACLVPRVDRYWRTTL